MIFFQGLVTDNNLNEKLGLSMIACVLLMTSVTVLDIAYSIIRTACLYAYKYYQIYKRKIDKNRNQKVIHVQEPIEEEDDRVIDLERVDTKSPREIQQATD